MKDTIYFNDLYDLYGDLFTDKQKMYFEDYYFRDLSLGEMADNYGVSRNAIFKQIRIVTDKLKYYDDKLHLYNKRKKIEEIIHNTNDNDLIEKLEKLI